MTPPARPANEAARLQALRRYEVLDTPPEPAIDALTRLAAHLMKVPVALVSLVDADRQWFKSRHGIEASETPREISFCGHVVADDRPLVVEDATADPRFADNPLVAGPSGIRFYAGYPLRTPDGFVLGTLCTLDFKPRRLDPEERELLGLLAAQAMDQMDRRRENLVLAEREGRLSALLATAVDAIITIDDRGTIEQVNPATERLFGYAAEELVGRNVRMLMPSPHRERHDGYLEAYRDSGAHGVVGSRRDVEALRKDGSVFPVELAVSEVRTGGTLRFTGILRDVSERKASLARLEAALEDNAQNAANLRSLLDIMYLGTVMMGPDGRIEFLNARAQVLLGLGPTDAVGRTCAEVMPGGAAYPARVKEVMAMPPDRRPRIPLVIEREGRGTAHLELDVRDDPRDPARHVLLVRDVSEVHDLRAQTNRLALGRLVGTGPAMAEVFRGIRDVAAGDWPTLIEGETGTGKELVARAIHAASARRSGRFVALNCGGLTESLLSSQLFGHKRGAFTGAVSDQEGVFEAADGGTLLLDEIGEMPPGVQAHLLRVLQENEIVRVGETRPRKVDVRVLAATNRSLSAEVAAGRFRSDLMYRIRVARLRLPPLRQRPEDIPLLVETFLAEARADSGKPVRDVGPDAMAALVAHAWPGNVRELKAAIDHAVIRCQEEVVERRDLPREIATGEPSSTSLPSLAHLPLTPPPGWVPPPPAAAPTRTEGPRFPAGSSVAEVLAADERERILDALRQARGNRLEAAQLLGISRATFYRRLAACGLDLGKGE